MIANQTKCVVCGKEEKIIARGMCKSCYQKYYRENKDDISGITPYIGRVINGWKVTGVDPINNHLELRCMNCGYVRGVSKIAITNDRIAPHVCNDLYICYTTREYLLMLSLKEHDFNIGKTAQDEGMTNRYVRDIAKVCYQRGRLRQMEFTEGGIIDCRSENHGEGERGLADEL